MGNNGKPYRNHGVVWISLTQHTPKTPLWDAGRPQKETVDLGRRQEITGSIHDTGCGTGEHVPFFAAGGFGVRGIGSSPRAVRIAQSKAAARGLNVHFVVPDTRNHPQLNRKSGSVTDSGLFYPLSDEDCTVFADTLAAALPPCGK